MPLRIAHINTEKGFSGGEAQLFLLLDGLCRRGYENVVFCQPRSRVAAAAATRGLTCLALPMRHALDLPGVVRLAAGLRSCGADVVHLHTGRAAWLGGLAARAARLPALTTCRMERRFRRGWRTRLIYETLARRVVAISPHIAASLMHGGVAGDRCLTIRSSVDPAALRPRVGRVATRAALGVGGDEPVVLVLAALIHRKGHDVLLAALAKLAADGVRPWLWVAGDGPERIALEEQCARLCLSERVRFLGRREDRGDLLAGCDFLVLPSRREGLGVAALEAMAAARAVVATRVGGLQEAVVHGKTGLLVPVADVGELAAAVGNLCRDEELRRRLGGAGPERIADGYAAEQMVRAYECVYGSVVSEWERRKERA